jgi:hypothetical protein
LEALCKTLSREQARMAEQELARRTFEKVEAELVGGRGTDCMVSCSWRLFREYIIA